jgi:hypothetical protein
MNGSTKGGLSILWNSATKGLNYGCTEHLGESPGIMEKAHPKRLLII